jgi:hypothetical protein
MSTHGEFVVEGIVVFYRYDGRDVLLIEQLTFIAGQGDKEKEKESQVCFSDQHTIEATVLRAVLWTSAKRDSLS